MHGRVCHRFDRPAAQSRFANSVLKRLCDQLKSVGVGSALLDLLLYCVTGSEKGSEGAEWRFAIIKSPKAKPSTSLTSFLPSVSVSSGRCCCCCTVLGNHHGCLPSSSLSGRRHTIPISPMQSHQPSPAQPVPGHRADRGALNANSGSSSSNRRFRFVRSLW